MQKYSPKSPILFKKIALFAERFASGLSYQKFINKYDITPIPSQPTNNCIKFVEDTIININNVKSVKYIINLLNEGSVNI